MALLLAGGVGQRAAQGGPKQLAAIGDTTVLELAVAAFTRHARVDRVLVVMPADLVEPTAALLPQVLVVAGGRTRQVSAAAGLEHINDDGALVLIHDVARPFVAAEVIDRCLDALATHDAVGTVIASTDSVYRVRQGPEGDELVEVPDRSTLRRAQTPQGFVCGVIRDAHRKAAAVGSDATDDCTVVLLHRPDVRIALVAGDESNLKLTTPGDFDGVRGQARGRPVK